MLQTFFQGRGQIPHKFLEMKAAYCNKGGEISFLTMPKPLLFEGLKASAEITPKEMLIISHFVCTAGAKYIKMPVKLGLNCRVKNDSTLLRLYYLSFLPSGGGPFRGKYSINFNQLIKYFAFKSLQKRRMKLPKGVIQNPKIFGAMRYNKRGTNPRPQKLLLILMEIQLAKNSQGRFDYLNSISRICPIKITTSLPEEGIIKIIQKLQLNIFMTTKKSYTYPIFTVRWLAVHALAVPTIFFLGAITAMQFIQRQTQQSQIAFSKSFAFAKHQNNLNSPLQGNYLIVPKRQNNQNKAALNYLHKQLALPGDY
eukprot:TRINITY_DN11309_c0_g1_i9.p1 TRINITY_DN11309_c0_g1~~TRINITY_DN11309_c0_g1_i9.p1  ORF type:complete len:311 (+),score=17.65 TRINITY_DN11309_c0_g1_i9:1383-2315(+)